MYKFLLILFYYIATQCQSQPLNSFGGKYIFLEKKCNFCHTIKSYKVELLKQNNKTKGPDLSAIGLKKQKESIQKYIKKEESVNGRKHLVVINASNETIDSLCNWLSNLKDSLISK